MVSERRAGTGLAENATFRGPDLRLFVRDVRQVSTKKRGFTVRSWATIKDAKDAIQRLTGIPVHAQRLYFGPLLSSGKELPNYRTLSDAGIDRSGETLLLDIVDGGNGALNGASSTSLARGGANDLCISTSLLNSTPKPLRSTIQHAKRAFALGIKPDLVMDGSGGSYYIFDAKKNKIAVFKPADEEPYAENNPRGYVPSPNVSDALRQGIAPGEACIREVAAYLLDHQGFANVPMTSLCEARHAAFNTNGARLKVSQGGASIGAHSIGASSTSSLSSLLNAPTPAVAKKVGSFQEFVRSEGSMDDLSPSKLSVDQVHKIAILDIRLLNADRNSANLLVRRLPDNSLELVPIDHGYCLRSMCDVSWMDWCWLDWPQLKEPLSQHSKDYIAKLDIETDARILSERLNICEEAIDYLRASTSILKAGVQAGLSLYDIAVMCCRNDNLAEKPSLLEHLTSMALELASVAVNDKQHGANFGHPFDHAMASRALQEQLSPKRPAAATPAVAIVTSRDRSSSQFHRCASSGEFLSLAASEDEEDGDDGFFMELPRSNLSRALEAQQDGRTPPPSILPMSGSDSSSDNGKDVAEEQDEAVEQWAHSIIEDSFQSVVPIARNPRSGSLSSEDESLSSSPKGFWHVRPGSVAGGDCWSDEEGSLVSFGTSPSTSDGMVAPPPEKQRRQSVTFADPPTKPSPAPYCRPPSTVNVVQAPPQQEAPQTPPLVQRQESGMMRSKSFAALSRSFSSGDSVANTKTAMAVPQSSQGASAAAVNSNADGKDHAYYRTYFLKFIDLVIAREMASRRKALVA